MPTVNYMTRRVAIRLIDSIMQGYADRTMKHVVEFCDAHGVNFTAGQGIWWFSTPTGADLELTSDGRVIGGVGDEFSPEFVEAYKDIHRVLSDDLDGYARSNVGATLCRDYHPWAPA